MFGFILFGTSLPIPITTLSPITVSSATIGENSVIPSNVQIGKNTAISGVTAAEDYEDGVLASGETLIKAGERV